MTVNYLTAALVYKELKAHSPLDRGFVLTMAKSIVDLDNSTL